MAGLTPAEARALDTLLVALGRHLGGGDAGSDAVLAALAEPEAVAAFADQVVAQRLVDPDVFERFVVTVTPTAGSATAKASVHLLRARLREWHGDAAGMNDELRRALECDPDHGPALLDAGWSASIEGRGNDALRAMERGDAGDEPTARLLRALPIDRTLRPGRNDPCPCGSGRKSKWCCPGRTPAPLQARREWLVDKAVSFVHRPPQRTELIAAASAFAGLDDPAQHPEAVLVAACEPIVAGVLLWEGGLLARFSQQHGAVLPPDELVLSSEWQALRHGVWLPTHGGDIVEWETGRHLPLVAAPDELRRDTWHLGVVEEHADGARLVGHAERLPEAAGPELAALCSAPVDHLRLATALGAHVGWTSRSADPIPG